MKLLTLILIFSWIATPELRLRPQAWSLGSSLGTELVAEISTLSLEIDTEIKIEAESGMITMTFSEEMNGYDLVIIEGKGALKMAYKLDETDELLIDYSGYNQGSFFLNIISRDDKTKRNTYRLSLIASEE
jgi:hypothetical protein